MAIRAGDLIILDRNDRSEDRTIQRDAKIGKIRRVSEGIYVINNDKAVEEIICGQWAAILARYAPGAVLQGRSAIREGVWRVIQNLLTTSRSHHPRIAALSGSDVEDLDG